jgi:DNA-binding PadR family transcriptional regulator
MDRERPLDRLLPLRPVEFDILLSLAAGERHGYGIIQDAEERGLGPAPDVGTLYRGLRRLQDQGFIRSSAGPASADSHDDRRNYYELTSLGRRVAQAEARRLHALARAARASGLLRASES